MASIGFAELETVTQALVNNGAPASDSLTVIPPQEKMARNGLTDPTETLFRIGLIQSQQVEHFVEGMSGLDSTFVGRLTSGFITEYQRLTLEGLEGDSLFEAMRLFSAQGRLQIQHKVQDWQSWFTCLNGARCSNSDVVTKQTHPYEPLSGRDRGPNSKAFRCSIHR